MGWRGWLSIGVLLVVPGLALAEPRAQSGPTENYDSACALAESIAGKLGYVGHLAHDKAQQACQSLVPSMMGAEQRTEFLRCCMRRLESGEPAVKPDTGTPQKKTKQKGI